MLLHTLTWVVSCPFSPCCALPPPHHPQELFDPLQLMYASLVSTGDESTANHGLLDMLRQVTTFGLSLMKLDIRQESTRHAEVCVLLFACAGGGGGRGKEVHAAGGAGLDLHIGNQGGVLRGESKVRAR